METRSRITQGMKGKGKLRSVFALTMILAITAIVSACGNSNTASSGASDTIVIATKGFAESDILANAIKLLIEDSTSLKTEVKTLDNKLLWDAINAGDVDTYVEYTGTALLNILKEQPEYDPDKSYEKVAKLLKEKNQLTVLDPIGFNNTYSLAITKEKADKLGITNISQLSEKSGQLVLGASQEFLNRPDAWPYVEEVYAPKFKETKNIQDKALQYKAIEQNLIDVMIPYTTDSQILSFGMVALEDDKHVFLPYDAIPVIRDATLEAHPELKDIVNKLAGKIDEAQMQKLNGEVELKQRPPLDVAKEWLQAQGLIKK